MQLVEAVILLFAGMVPGVWVTLVDVYALGAPAFSTRIALWILLIVLFATNMRHRRQAAWGSAWLSLGCVESYYLSSAYTFEGMSRSTVGPLALLSVVAAGIAWLSWTAKRERGTFGLALKALVVVATLVACVATHDGLTALDAVCVLGIAFCLFLMRSRRIALERHRPDTPLVLGEASEDVATEGRSHGSRRGTPSSGERPSGRSRDLSTHNGVGESRSSGRSRGERRRLADSGRRRTRRATGRRWSAASEARAVSSAARDGHASRAGSQAASERPARVERPAVTALRLKRDLHPSRTSVASGKRAASPSATKAPTAKPARAAGAKAASKASPKTARVQRPTKRTGGAVPEANRMRSSSSDGHAHTSAKPHRRTGSSGSGSRR